MWPLAISGYDFPKDVMELFRDYQFNGGSKLESPFQTTPKPKQNHLAEKATPEKKTPIFAVIGKGLFFAPTTRQQNLVHA